VRGRVKRVSEGGRNIDDKQGCECTVVTRGIDYEDHREKEADKA